MGAISGHPRGTLLAKLLRNTFIKARKIESKIFYLKLKMLGEKSQTMNAKERAEWV